MPFHTSPVISYVKCSEDTLCKAREQTQGAIPGFTDAVLGGDRAGESVVTLTIITASSLAFGEKCILAVKLTVSGEAFVWTWRINSDG